MKYDQIGGPNTPYPIIYLQCWGRLCFLVPMGGLVEEGRNGGGGGWVQSIISRPNFF